MGEGRWLASIEAWGPGLDAYDADVLSELAPTLSALGADGAAVGAGGRAGGPSASLGVPALPDEPLEKVVGRAIEWFTRGCAELGLQHDGIAWVEVEAERHWELELERESEGYLGVSEIARMLGVSRQRVSELRARPDFPDPVAELAAGPVWKETHLLRFIEEWPRKPGRPRKLESA